MQPHQTIVHALVWTTLTFTIPASIMAQGKVQRIGFGGGDSEIWVRGVRISQ